MRSDLNHKKTYPQIRLFKNFILHQYDAIDIQIWWNVVNQEECVN